MRGSVDLAGRPSTGMNSHREGMHPSASPLIKVDRLKPNYSRQMTAQQLSKLNQWYYNLTPNQKQAVMIKLIKIQAAWRGYIVRKRFQIIK